MFHSVRTDFGDKYRLLCMGVDVQSCAFAFKNRFYSDYLAATGLPLKIIPKAVSV